MNAGVLERPVEEKTDTEDKNNVWHYLCDCSPDIGLCGKDLSGDEILEYSPPDENTCPLCALVEWSPCPRCGG